MKRGATAATLIVLAMSFLHGAPHAARSETAVAAAATPGSGACDHRTFRVVVDVGHTAGKPGAKSARGFDEYDFNLRLAKEIDQKLIAAGFEKTVLLITTEAPRAGLFKRAARANAMSADLFLAVHHDSVPDSFLQKWQYEGQEHTFSDRFPGHSIFISNDNPQRDRSLAFGKLIGDELKARGLKYTPHYTEKFMGHRRRVLVDAEAGVYRYDQLVVLRSTRMPAVLLEAGSIINRDEELELGTPERRSLTSDAVAAAVESYCAAHSRPGRDLLAHRAHAQNTVRPAVTAPVGNTAKHP